MRGRINCYLSNKDLGYILGEDDKNYAFKKSDLTNYKQEELDNLEVEFDEDLNSSGYLARNIVILNVQNAYQNNFYKTKVNFNNSDFNLKEYKLLEGIYISKNYDFLDGELIYASSYELSTHSSASTEDALEKLKSVAVKLGFNALINFESDSEIEFSMSASTSKSTINKNIFSDSFSADTSTFGASCDFNKYYVKARLGLIGIKGNSLDDINLNELEEKMDIFNSVFIITNSFYSDCTKYASNFKTDKIITGYTVFMAIFLAIIFSIISATKGAPMFMVLPLIFLIFISVLIIVFSGIYTFFNKKKTRKIILKDCEIYEKLQAMLGDDIYCFIFSNLDDIKIKKIGA